MLYDHLGREIERKNRLGFRFGRAEYSIARARPADAAECIAGSSIPAPEEDEDEDEDQTRRTLCTRAIATTRPKCR